MKKGSKYEPLYRHLRESGKDELTISIAEIEKFVGVLPDSAYTSNAFWSNRNGGLQAAAWMEAGYHSVKINLEKEQVTFQKPIRKYHIKRAGDDVVWTGELIKMLRAHMALNQTEFANQIGVTQETISEWERSDYEPRRAMHKLLTIVAERAGFIYS